MKWLGWFWDRKLPVKKFEAGKWLLKNVHDIYSNGWRLSYVNSKLETPGVFTSFLLPRFELNGKSYGWLHDAVLR